MSGAPEVGREVGGYRLLEPLGAGGEGAVFLAESTDGLGKRVALKVFAPEARARFERELEAYRRLEETRQRTGTPHLAEGLAAGPLPDGGGFIALAFQAGGTLADRVRRQGPLAADDAVRVVRQVLTGLEHLHAAGLCHRDVKPHNVLLGADGVARLGDFGLAQEHDDRVSTGGTPAFAAPEQWSIHDDAGCDAGAAARSERRGTGIDVYGAGATLYYLLTGRSPPPGAPDLFLLEARAVPRALQSVLLTALAARPEDRFADARAFALALERTTTRPPPPPGGARRPLALAMGVAAAVALVAWTTLRAPTAAPSTTSPPSSSAPSPPPSAAPHADAPAPPPIASLTPPDPTPARPSPGADAPVDLPARTAPAPSSPGVEVHVGEDGCEVWLRDEGGARLRLGAWAAPSGVLAARLPSGRAAVAVPALDGASPRLARFDARGAPLHDAPLPAAAASLLALPADGVAVATIDGRALIVSAAGQVREVARFEEDVLDLRVDAGALRITGDDRVPRPLAADEPAPADATVVEGALGRYAFPRAPLVREVVVPLAD